MKKYVVEFTMVDGSIQEVELTTDKIEWSIDQWIRHRPVAKYEIISEGNSNSKQMLLG